MGSNKSIIGSARRWLLVATFASTVPAAFAQESPVGVPDDVNATMRIIGNPSAEKPDEIVRKISTRKPKRSLKSTESLAKDLVDPGKDETDETDESGEESGTPNDPGTTTDPDTPDGPGTADPDVPIDPAIPTPVDTGHGNSGAPPDVPRGNGPGEHGNGNGPGGGHGPHDGGPDPRERVGGLGQQASEGAKNRGEDVRRHHDSPPEPKPPKDKAPRGPGSKPPAAPPRDRGPPDRRPPDMRPPGPKPPGAPPKPPRRE